MSMPGGPFAGLIFVIGIGGLLVVASENEVAASVAQGILLVALLLILITLLNGHSGVDIFTGGSSKAEPIYDKGGNQQ